jgi:hypothetical protein
VRISIARCMYVGNSTMARHTSKGIATGALGLALSTTSIVPPPAVAAEALTKEQFDAGIQQLTKDIGKAIKDNNRDLADEIANAINRASDRHHVSTPVVHDRVVVVERPVHVAHRPLWCCRPPPPPPPCPPWWGW